MSNQVVSLLLAIGGGAWIYNKLLKTTGNNTRSSFVVAGISALFIFVLVGVALSLINNSLQK